LRFGSSSSSIAARLARPSMSGQARGMATLKEIQVRLKSIKNIAKITKSMKMIASTKLVRAQKAMESARAYGEASHSLLKVLEPKATEGKTLIIACSSDRGLCGAIHGTIAKPIRNRLRQEADKMGVVVIGDKVRGQVTRANRNAVVASFNSVGKNIPTFDEAAQITELVLAHKKISEFGKLEVYYNRFKSVIAYELDVIPVFPENVLSVSDKLSQFELEDDAVLKNLAEFTLANAVFHGLVEGNASEMAARRTAMENATKNASDMIDKLTMVYNRSRQATITNELVDIITGASAL